MSFLAEFWDDFLIPFRALVVAVGGVLLAHFWFEGLWPLAIGMLVVGVLIGEGALRLGSALLPRHPVVALEVLEFCVVAPAALAGGAAASGIIIGLELAVSEPPELKALAGALATGITAFMTTVFISWSADRTDSKIANRIRNVFIAHYRRAGQSDNGERSVAYFAADSPGERWVYSNAFKGVEGWSREARRKRARGIAAELPNAQIKESN